MIQRQFYKTLTEQQVIKNIIKTAHSILLSFMILIRFTMIHILMATILCSVQHLERKRGGW